MQFLAFVNKEVVNFLCAIGPIAFISQELYSVYVLLIYYAYFHSLMSYAINFWGNSPSSMQIFRLQKRIIRVMSGLKPRDSCRTAFKEWGILPLVNIYFL
jgi:hypothetical protein